MVPLCFTAGSEDTRHNKWQADRPQLSQFWDKRGVEWESLSDSAVITLANLSSPFFCTTTLENRTSAKKSKCSNYSCASSQCNNDNNLQVGSIESFVSHSCHTLGLIIARTGVMDDFQVTERKLREWGDWIIKLRLKGLGTLDGVFLLFLNLQVGYMWVCTSVCMCVCVCGAGGEAMN